MSIVSCKPTITRKELEGVLDCLINEDLLTGTTVKLFEGQASRHTGIKYALAVNSLTAAYHLAFKALEIAPGDEIIIPSYFDIAPLSAADLIGATPVLVDIEQGALAPSTSQIKEKITEKTKAIVFGHTFGFLTPL
ncbi:MAG TPA: DegT/DnrJ/EryC1/StrS family aminotransferase, partial [Spirochaetota bacterium]|nr:DegT/DnrJ/EryC1/StrS family aminotransferase [Spirochaetota bacterium]